MLALLCQMADSSHLCEHLVEAEASAHVFANVHVADLEHGIIQGNYCVR
uniref:Uncharacterized protein n=1 Tax=Pseudomonas aeruginosa TaxID=287 RepID=A0A7S6G5J4_PSEAI|nr:hypothetical protein [Pseudomonas aeruginosa]